MSKHPFVPHEFERLSEEEMVARADAFRAEMVARRSVRMVSDDPVPRALIERAIETASTAPSGAHRQPWHFVAVSDPAIKHEIRVQAEAEEQENYGGRFPEAWLEALAPLGTDADKRFLETVPWIVVVFEETYGFDETGERRKNYYVKESVGIACGMFITALHHMGLATLTHTPSPMRFLNSILGRPANEKPYILFPIGYPAPGAVVPELTRKALGDVSTWNPAPGGANPDDGSGTSG